MSVRSLLLAAAGAVSIGDVPNNGQNWTGHTLPTSQLWNGCAWGNNKFVVVGTTNNVATSPDGQTWTARTAVMPSNVNWTSVAYGNNIFVACNNANNTWATSPDGITWTPRTITAATNGILRFANGYFVFVPYNATTAMRSTDGISWTTSTMTTLTSWSTLAYGNNRWVAIDASSTGYVNYSTDNGVTWNQSSTFSNVGALAFGVGLFVAGSFGTSGLNTLMTSPDGITWTSRTFPADGTGQNANRSQFMIFGGGTFVLVRRPSAATDSSVYSTSSDGITWGAARTFPSVATYSSGAFSSNAPVGIFAIIGSQFSSAATNIMVSSP